VTGGDGVPVPMLVRRSDAAAGEPWTVVAGGPGKAGLAIPPPDLLLGARRPVVVDPRWTGEWQRYAATWRRNGLILGQGEAYQMAHDLALACASLPGEAEVTLVGLGSAGVGALLAAGLCPRIGHVVLENLGPTYAVDGNRLPLAPELLRSADLPELLQALGKRCRVTVGGFAGAPPLVNDALCRAVASAPR
jgi:hypothetical protein